MKLRLALEEKLMDVRVRDRLVAEGKISKEELKKYIDTLADEAKNAVPLDQDDTNSGNLQ
jgi:polyhydroxyalkanoate synthesis regulator phasin